MQNIQFENPIDLLNDITFGPINMNIEITMEDLYSMTQKFVTSFNKMYNTFDSYGYNNESVSVLINDFEKISINDNDESMNDLIRDFEKMSFNDNSSSASLPVIHIESNIHSSNESTNPNTNNGCWFYDIEENRYVKYDNESSKSYYIDTIPENETQKRKKIRIL